MNDITSTRRVEVHAIIDAFATPLAAMLTDLGHPDLLAPGYEDYSIVPTTGDLTIETELHLGFGAGVGVKMPFSCDPAIIAAAIVDLRERLVQMLAGLDNLVALRSEIDRQAMLLMRGAIQKGIRGRIVEVRLSAIDLTSTTCRAAVTVMVEGEACTMLRPFRDEWHVGSVDTLFERFEEFCRLALLWDAKRLAARASGAVGFIDPLVLVAIDALPGGRQTALQTIARKLEQAWYSDTEGQHREMTGLTWHDGLVYPVARLSAHVELSGPDLYLHDTEVTQASVGRRISEFVDHPALAGRVIAKVAFERPGFAQVRLSPSLLPFTASGEVLAG